MKKDNVKNKTKYKKIHNNAKFFYWFDILFVISLT